MSNETKGQQLTTFASETPAELSSTYRPEPRSGPSENVNAVWTVLEANWPNAFKKVDLNDPSKTWADNLDDLSSRQMSEGLKALRRLDDRYMPNAPACRQLMLDAARSNESPPPAIEDRRDDIERLFNSLRGTGWMAYATKMISERDLEITNDMARRCCAIAKKKTAEYEHAWRTESNQDDENWRAIAISATNQLLASWNRICKVPAKKAMKKHDDLYPPK